MDKSKHAGGKVASAGGKAARAAGRAARAVGHAAPDKVIDMAIEEGASLASHLSAHAAHRYLGCIGVGVKGGLELLAVIVAKLKKASPRVLRGLRSTLRGTLHHALGTGLHRALPLPPCPGKGTTTTSGAETSGAEVGEAEIEDDDAAQDNRF